MKEKTPLALWVSLCFLGKLTISKCRYNVDCYIGLRKSVKMEKSVFCDPAFRLCGSESQRKKDFGLIEAFIQLKTVDKNFLFHCGQSYPLEY